MILEVAFYETYKDNSYVVKAKRREDNSNQRWKGFLHYLAMRHPQLNCQSMCGIQSNENNQGHGAWSGKKKKKTQAQNQELMLVT